MNNEMTELLEKVVKAALLNGANPEQILNSPDLAFKAYFEMQEREDKKLLNNSEFINEIKKQVAK